MLKASYNLIIGPKAKYTGCIKKKLNKSELALQLCQAREYTKFFVEMGCLGTNNVVFIIIIIQKSLYTVAYSVTYQYINYLQN